jgi:tetratricopeptide (TPR) repeat protein
MTKKKIDEAAAEFHAQIDGFRMTTERAGGESTELASELAVACNQYAWLVGNTYGDFDEAVKLAHEAVKISQEVLDLRPSQGGFLDTLGRCYFAKDDLVNAVKYQSQAVKLNSGSGQIRRQLAFFVQEARNRGVKLPQDEASNFENGGQKQGQSAPTRALQGKSRTTPATNSVKQ